MLHILRTAGDVHVINGCTNELFDDRQELGLAKVRAALLGCSLRLELQLEVQVVSSVLCR